MIGIKEYQQILTEDLPKPVIKRFKRRKVGSRFKDIAGIDT